MAGSLGWFVNCGWDVVRDRSGFLGACGMHESTELEVVDNSRAGANRESALSAYCVESGSLYVCLRPMWQGCKVCLYRRAAS